MSKSRIITHRCVSTQRHKNHSQCAVNCVLVQQMATLCIQPREMCAHALHAYSYADASSLY